MQSRSYEFHKKIENCISFIVESINKQGHNPKPVILHSIRVGMTLYEYNYSEDIVVAGFLHDILEDTDVKKDVIQKKFGKYVTDLVVANSFDLNIKDSEKRYIDIFERCIKKGEDALIIKTADLLDNLPYYNWPDDTYAKKKIAFFIHKAKPFIFQEALFQKFIYDFEYLQNKYKKQ